LMCIVFMNSQAVDRAQRVVHEAQVLYQRIGDKVGEADALRMIACIELELLNIDLRSQDAKKEANIRRRQTSLLKASEKAVAVARKSSSKGLLASCLHLFAQVLNACGRGEEAADAAEEASVLFMECGDTDGEAHALVVAADACIVQKKRAEATSFVNRAVEMFQQLGNADAETFAKSILEGSVSIAATAAMLADDSAVSGGASLSIEDGGQKTGMALDDAKKMVLDVALQAIGDDDAIDFDSPLMDIGLDSLSAIAFRENLIRASSLKVPSSLVFDYPSLIAVAEHLVETSLE